jgi:hypothetical protein
MSFPVFRGALYRLRASGRVHFSGSSPESSGVKMRTLEPAGHDGPEQVRVQDVDLGYGDFLLPGTPASIVQIATERQ